MIIGFDFSESVFIHAIVHAQDQLSGFRAYDEGISYLKNFYQNYEIFIGNNSSFSKNQKCDGGPFLDPNNSATYVHD